MSAPIDMIGKRFGRLLVHKREGSNSDGKALWGCQCDCGNYHIVLGSILRNGRSNSCGCYKKDKIFETARKRSQVQIGKVYGKLTVIDDAGLKIIPGTQSRHWSICRCECGNIIEAADNSLQQGKLQSCGCLNSQGEMIICKILDENNIIYEHNKTFKLLTEESGRALRFDFIIYNKDKTINRFVEFDGIQHIGGTWFDSEPYEALQQKDNLKNQFCLSHNYVLVRIPYSKKNTLTLEDIMGPKFILQ